MKVAVTADTHLRHALSSHLPQHAVQLLADADVILHAGDITSRAVLEELNAMAPVHAVLGNNDTELSGVLPGSLELDLEGLHVAMVHDSGPAAGRERRLKRAFPDAALVVFGHSHVPLDAEGVEGQRLFNPGSPTQRRRQPFPTIGLLRIARGVLTTHEIVALASRSPSGDEVRAHRGQGATNGGST